MRDRVCRLKKRHTFLLEFFLSKPELVLQFLVLSKQILVQLAPGIVAELQRK